MKKIRDFSNKLGGFSCLLAVFVFWATKLIETISIEISPYRPNHFDFLEQATPIDPIDFANFIFQFINLYYV